GIMTNYALKEQRRKHAGRGGWAILLQADEVLHEADLNQLKQDIILAEAEGKDCLSLRYLHFWKSHYQVAYEKRWYPQEIRVIKLDSDIWNYGDGQTFSGQVGVYDSDVAVFHYGHVREEDKYQQKMQAQRELHYKGLR